MKYLKFTVHSQEHSDAIQNRLFEMGCRWPYAKASRINTDRIHVDLPEKTIYTYVFLNPEEYVDATLDDLYKPEVINEEYLNGSTAVIDGHTYKLTLID